MTKPTKKGDAKNITQLNRKQGIMRNKSAFNIYYTKFQNHTINASLGV